MNEQRKSTVTAAELDELETWHKECAKTARALDRFGVCAMHLKSATALATLRRELSEAHDDIKALCDERRELRADNAKKDAALRCARIKLSRYWEQHGSSAIGGVAAEYDAVVKLIDAALAPAAQEENQPFDSDLEAKRRIRDRQKAESRKHIAPAPGAGKTLLEGPDAQARRIVREWLSGVSTDLAANELDQLRAAISIGLSASAPSAGETTLRELHEAVIGVSAIFDAPLTDETVSKWQRLNNAQASAKAHLVAAPPTS